MSDTDLSPSWHQLAGRLRGADEADLGWGLATTGDIFPGRHSNQDEIAAETPIFHDLTRNRQPARRREPAHLPSPHNPSPYNPSSHAGAHAGSPGGGPHIPTPRPDPLIEFTRNPLTAPIPGQVNADPVVTLGPQLRRTVGTLALVSPPPARPAREIPRRGRHHRPGDQG